MSDKTLYTIIVHSENIAGLLNQVTAVFTRRQINIESLNVSASSIKGVHKYTITAWTDKDIIEKVVKQDSTVKVPHDTVLEELKRIADMSGRESEDIAMAVAVYMLGFNSYLGFSDLMGNDTEGDNADNNYLKRIYAYAKELKREGMKKDDYIKKGNNS